MLQAPWQSPCLSPKRLRQHSILNGLRTGPGGTPVLRNTAMPADPARFLQALQEFRSLFGQLFGLGVCPEWHGIKPHFVAQFLEKSRIPVEQRHPECLPLQGLRREISLDSTCSATCSFSTKVCLIPCHSGLSQGQCPRVSVPGSVPNNRPFRRGICGNGG